MPGSAIRSWRILDSGEGDNPPLRYVRQNSRRVGGSFVTFDLLAGQRGCAGEQQAVLELGFLKQSIDVSALVDNSYIQGL